eukprot:TRINITY_DN7343_c0_g2_i1.p1 TRINITY_DN7343_c0_g2~~TRINITY_DN7343_c0_g2_i1.p1  ORF type:complete len:532 (+),score=25.85 TRINITY_DN7343_c0_g2_i1:129-1598(+)
MGGGWIYSAGTVPINQWVHVAVTVDIPANKVVFYLNGNVLSTHTGITLTAPDNGPVTIGMQSPTTCQCNNFDGKMDELRIWTRTLSQCEIISNMNCELNPAGQTGLGALYRFNQGYTNLTNAITTLTDASGNGNTGTLTNFALTGSTSNWSSGTLGNAGTTSCAITSAVSITTQPTNQATCAGVNAVFTATASGTGLNYEWQVNTGSGFAAISNSALYSGFTSNALTVLAPIAGMNGYQYRLIVRSTMCPTLSFTSNTVTLTVNTSPVILNQPVAATTCSGSNAAFTVVAAGTALTYQWQENTGSGFANITNGGIYSNATTATLNLTGATATMNTYTYRCVISGTCIPAVTTNAAALTVNTLPAIGTHPSNVTLCAGATATFTVVATGTSLAYQWQENTGSGWANLPNTSPYFNVSTSTLSITPTNAGMNTYQYRCVVSGTCTPSVTSNPVTLTVNTAPAITAQPVASVICLNGNTSYSVTATGTALTY